MANQKAENSGAKGKAAKSSGDEQSSAGQSYIRIQLYRSTISFPVKQKVLVRSLGLTKLNQVVERPDTAAMRGAVRKAPHLLRIVE